MKSPAGIFQEYVKKIFPFEAYKKLQAEVDKDVIEELAAEGRTKKEILDLVSELSLACKNVTTEERNAYLNKIQEIIPDNSVQTKDELEPRAVYQISRNKFAKEFGKLFKSLEARGIVKLLDDGYPLGTAITVLNKHSFLANEVTDIPFVSEYTEDVLNQMNEVRMMSMIDTYDRARESYLTRANQNFNHGRYDVFNEGYVVLDMMLWDRFSSDTIRKVLQSSSLLEDHSNAAVDKLMEQCEFVREIYEDIKKPLPEKINTPKTIYQACAKPYMESMHISRLTEKDDQQIVKRLKSIEPPMSDEAIQAVMMYSPVAHEPGKNPEIYAFTCVANTNALYAARKAYAENHFSETEQAFESRIQEMKEQREKEAHPELPSQEYSECLVALQLLESKQPKSNVKRVFEHSPFAMLKSQSNENWDVKKYAERIVNAAEKAQSAIHRILFEKKPEIEKKPYKALLAIGFTAADLFLHTLKTMAMERPSLLTRFTEDKVTIAAAERMFAMFAPGMTEEDKTLFRRDLAGAIREISPVIPLPGRGEEFADKLVELAEQEYVQGKIYREEAQSEMERNSKAYDKNREDSKSGLGTSSNTRLCIGMAVVRMLMDDKNPADIRDALLYTDNDLKPEDVDNIVAQAETALERMKILRNHESVEQELFNRLSTAEQCEEEYKSKLLEKCREIDDIQPRIEIEVTAMLMASGRYDESLISQILSENSPIAVEPGRDAGYIEYIKNCAREKLELERKRLEAYKVIPRKDASNDIGEEYGYHMQHMKDIFKVSPYNSLMDVKVGEALLIEGFAVAAIAKAVQSLSPIAEKEGSSYGSFISNALTTSDGMEKSNTDVQEQGLAQSLVRSLGTPSSSDE